MAVAGQHVQSLATISEWFEKFLKKKKNMTEMPKNKTRQQTVFELEKQKNLSGEMN